MSDKEILEKAIQKAIDGGLTGFWKNRYEMCQELNEMQFLTGGNLAEMGHSIESLIYDHQFAKALWNTPRFAPAGSIHFETRDGLSEWQYHLKEMVVSPDPIQYLKDNI